MTRKRLTTDTTPARTLNTKSTGEILHSARIKQGLSIEQVSAAINIRPSMLKAIEEGRFFGLTDPLYLKGFIRSYAHHVGLSDDEVMPFFRRDYDEQEHQQHLTQPLAPIQAKKSKLTPGWAIVGFLVVMVIAVIGYAYQQYVSVALTPQLQIDKPSNQTQTNSSQVTAIGHTDPDANLSLNGQLLQLDPNGNFSTIVGLASGSNQLTFKATNKLGKSISIQRTVISSQPLAQNQTTSTALSANSSTNIASNSATPKDPSATPLPFTINLVIGPDPTLIDITTDGQQAFSGVLLPGASQTFTASSRIHIKTGNAGSTRVILKGQDQGTLGPDNQPAERDYTQ
jgi:cytoskeletal protein RodZ